MGLARTKPQFRVRLSPRTRHGGRELAAQRAGDGLFLEFVVTREPDLDARGGRGNRVQPLDEGLRLGSPDAGGRLVGAGVARTVRPGRLGVGEEEPVQVCGDGPGADPGPGGGGEGLARESRGRDAGDQPPVLGGAVRLECPPALQVEALAQVRIDLGTGFAAVEGQGEGGDRAAVQAGADDGAGVGGRRVQQDGLVPPGVADVVGEALHKIGAGADVPGGQVLLEGQVREGVPAGGRLDEQAVARDVVEERLAGDRRGRSVPAGA